MKTTIRIPVTLTIGDERVELDLHTISALLLALPIRTLIRVGMELADAARVALYGAHDVAPCPVDALRRLGVVTVVDTDDGTELSVSDVERFEEVPAGLPEHCVAEHLTRALGARLIRAFGLHEQSNKLAEIVGRNFLVPSDLVGQLIEDPRARDENGSPLVPDELFREWTDAIVARTYASGDVVRAALLDRLDALLGEHCDFRRLPARAPIVVAPLPVAAE